MKRMLMTALCATVLATGTAQAACLVQYKAKRDNPLRLHYGIIELADSQCGNPGPAIQRRIARDGWQLLTVMGRLSREQAQARRKDAGAYYLRY